MNATSLKALLALVLEVRPERDFVGEYVIAAPLAKPLPRVGDTLTANRCTDPIGRGVLLAREDEQLGVRAQHFAHGVLKVPCRCASTRWRTSFTQRRGMRSRHGFPSDINSSTPN